MDPRPTLSAGAHADARGEETTMMQDDQDQVDANEMGQAANKEKKGAGGGDKDTAKGDPDPNCKPPPLTELQEVTKARILADASRELAQANEERVTKGAEVRTAYEAELKALRERHDKADKRFVDIANDLMRPVPDGGSRLDMWVAAWLQPGKPLRELFRSREAAAAAFAALRGERERDREKTAAAAEQLKKASGDWAAPHTAIAAILSNYEGRFDTLNRNISSQDQTTEVAIYEFWFEVAPQHLQLRSEAVTDDNTPGLGTIMKGLEGLPEHQRVLQSGKLREDKSVFLIAPGELDGHRKEVGVAWAKAVDCAATAAALYSLAPDDAETLKAHLQTLLQNESAEAKKRLGSAA
jgi:hypothetical protein